MRRLIARISWWWQNVRAGRDIRRGRCRTFASADEAIAWLKSLED